MLKITPNELWQEITKARALAEQVNAAREQMVKAYAGDHFRGDWQPQGPRMIDNRFDEWLRLVLPQIVFDNPRVRVKSGRSGVNPAVPRAMEAALNWWAPQVGLRNLLTLAAYDAAFTYGVLMTHHGTRPGGEPFRSGRDTEAVAGLPRVTRIAPTRWFCDPGCDTYDPANGQGRYAGHMFRADKEDLTRDKRYNREVVERCAADAGQEHYGGEKTQRNEVYGYEVWVPEIRTGDHPDANGTIFTLALGKDLETGKNAQWIRDPRAHIGPPQGMYALIGFGIMPGSPYPYSPFAASWDQVLTLNQHLNAANKSAARKKRFGLVDAENTQAFDLLTKIRDGDVGKMRDFKNAAIEMQLGGVTQDQVEHNQRLGEQVDRSLSLSETARGNVNVGTSATAVADAASQRNARLASMKRMMTDGAAQVLRTAAWHLYTHEDAVFPLPPDVAEAFVPRPSGLPDPSQAESLALQMGVSTLEVRKMLEHQPTVIYGGGPSEDVISEAVGSDGEPVYVVSPNVGGMRFVDFELQIEPYSMERVDEALLQRRSMQVTEVFMQVLPMIAQYPEAEWENLLDMIGEPLNMPELSEKLLGSAWLARIRQGAHAGLPGISTPAMPGTPGIPGVPAPTLAGDGADGMAGPIGASVYGGGDLSRAVSG